MTASRFAVRYAVGFVGLTAVLTIGFAFGENGRIPLLIQYILLLLLLPGALLRPDAWLFHHATLTAPVTSALAAFVWVVLFSIAHVLWVAGASLVSSARRAKAVR